MSPERWRKIRSIIDSALEQPLQNRLIYVGEICGEDFELRGEIESFLEYENIDGGFLEEHNLALTNLAEDFEDANIGREIGKYKITGEIGAGGMGAVYAAERSGGEFSHRVAVKFLRQSFSSKDTKRRFLQERQILASLKHPFIAQLIDGGATRDGAPYLVMELVEGTPITKYVEKNNLSLDENLELFLKICRAVSFAHQNFIVHRDLKPDNILITDDGTPKLLDFGIAKLVSENGHKFSTRFQVFTPEYAAPEQINGNRFTAASDVYSLGVILYEILTGSKPHKINSRIRLAQINSPFETKTIIPSAVSSKFKVQSSKFENGNKITTNKSDKRRADRKSKIQNPKSKIAQGRSGHDCHQIAQKKPFGTLRFGRKFCGRHSAFSETACRFRRARTRFFTALRNFSNATNCDRRRRFDFRRSDVRNRNRAVSGASGGNRANPRRTAFRRNPKSREIDDFQLLRRNQQTFGRDESALDDDFGRAEIISTSGKRRKRDAATAICRIEIAESFLRLGDVQGTAVRRKSRRHASALESYQKALNLLLNFSAGKSGIYENTREGFSKNGQIMSASE